MLVVSININGDVEIISGHRCTEDLSGTHVLDVLYRSVQSEHSNSKLFQTFDPELSWSSYTSVQTESEWLFTAGLCRSPPKVNVTREAPFQTHQVELHLKVNLFPLHCLCFCLFPIHSGDT